MPLASCQEQKALDADVVAAFDGFMAAVKARDAGRLYDLSPKPLHERMDALQTELSDLVGRLDSDYPMTDRPEALAAIGADLVRGTTSGRDLFVALVDFDAVRLGADAERGLAPAEVRVQEDEATLTTAGGETFQFVREDDEWRCTTLLTQLDRYPSLRRLRGNMKTASANLEAWLRATRETTDHGKPEGAFNLVVLSVRRGARMMIFSLLDEQSLERLKAATKVVAALQAAAEARYPKPSQRAEYLTGRGIAWVERVGDERALFAALWDNGVVKAELPFEADVQLLRSEPGEDKSATVVAKTANGESRTTFRRNIDGKWRLSSLEAALAREGLRKLEAELRAIPPAP